MSRAQRLSLIILTLLLYFQSLSFDFAYDDRLRIVKEPAVTAQGFSCQSFVSLFVRPTFPGNLYRPITDATFRLNFLVSGLNPKPFHLTNLLLHLLCVLAVFELVRLFTARALLSWVAAAWFAFHPVQVETVANISGRAEILAALFGFSAFFSFLKLSKSKGSSQVFWSGLSALLFLSATLSKESAFSFLFIIPLGSFCLRGHWEKSQSKGSLCLLLAASISLTARILVLWPHFFHQNSVPFQAENPLAGPQITFTERLIFGLQILGRYLGLIVAPLRLSADYSLGSKDFYATFYSAWGAFLIIVFVLWLLATYVTRKKTYSFFGWWFPLSLILTCNIFFPIGTIMAERLAYLPSIGAVAFLTCWTEERFLKVKVIKQLSAVIILASSAILTTERLPVWKNDLALFIQTAQDAPRSPKAAENLAKEFYHRLGDLERAEQYFRQALTLDRFRLEAMVYLIDLYNRKGDLPRAIYWSKELLAIDPSNSEVQKLLSKLEEFKQRQGGKSEPQSRSLN